MSCIQECVRYETFAELERFPPNDVALWAAFFGKVRVLEYALDRGAEVNKAMVEKAAKNGHSSMLEFLLNRGAPVSGGSVIEAVMNEQFEIARTLQNHGAVIDDDELVTHAFRASTALFNRLVAWGIPSVHSMVSTATNHHCGVYINQCLDDGVVPSDNATIRIVDFASPRLLIKLLRVVKVSSGMMHSALHRGDPAIAACLYQAGGSFDMLQEGRHMPFLRSPTNQHIKLLEVYGSTSDKLLRIFRDATPSMEHYLTRELAIDWIFVHNPDILTETPLPRTQWGLNHRHAANWNRYGLVNPALRQ